MRCSTLIGGLVLSAFVAAPQMTYCQSLSDEWTFQAIVYGYLPHLGGTTSFPAAGTSTSISVNVDQLLSSLNFAFMGTLEARKGAWGAFTDVMYLNLSGGKNGSRDFSLGNIGVPAAVSSDLNLKLSGGLWTIAGEYAAVKEPSTLFYVLAGARLFDLKQTLSYSLSTDVGPIAGPSRSGSSNVNPTYWDAIVGAKGRFALGDRGEWFLPYYADVGTGQSKLTWQIFGGAGYQFNSWGSVIAGWRYLDYDFKSSSKVESLNFNGPMIGVTFNW